jgi:hypothetical protein
MLNIRGRSDDRRLEYLIGLLVYAHDLTQQDVPRIEVVLP